jgi:hypothetical protein
VLASPFGQTPEAERAASLADDLLRQRSPEEALRACHEHGLRYLVLYDPLARERKAGEEPAAPAGLGRVGARLHAVYVGSPAAEGRVPRVFEIAPR